MPRPEFDLCVIGGGAAGLGVAAGGAILGAKVALVERAALGGECLYHGCVPSKALLHVARVAQQARDGGRFGVQTSHVEVDFRAAMAHVRGAIAAIEPRDSPQRFRELGVHLHFGAGRFVDPGTFAVDGARITARHFVLATGSHPVAPPVPGLDETGYLTNETVFDLDALPARLIVLGGGPIGCELAQAFARLGAAVTLIEQAPQLLQVEDADLSDVVATRLRGEGVTVHTGARVIAACRDGAQVALDIETGPGVQTVRGDRMLVAAGRAPNLDGLDLDAGGVALREGRVVLDARLRTTNRRIYACGDVAGPYRFTHMAEHQAGVVLRNALFRLPVRDHARAVPWCTFTDPELARVGWSERDAEARGARVEVYRHAFAEVDRAVADGCSEGFAKILTDRRGRLLGAAIVGTHAGELIHEYALALNRGLKASHISATIHVYPTLAEVNRRVADARRRAGLTPASRRWLQRLFRLRGG